MAFEKNFGFADKEVRMEMQQNKSSDILILLLDLLESVTQSSTFQGLLEKVGKASQKLMRVEASSLMLLDESGEFLEIVMPTGPVRDEIRGKKIPATHGYAGTVVESKTPVITNDVQKSKVFDGEVSDAFTTYNLICVPLFDTEENLIGVLEAINRSGKDHFKKADIPVFQALANHSARTLERIRSKDEVSKLLKEQDLFYREIHHRVKNDFALISGIVEMENIGTADDRVNSVLANVQSRIQMMATVYDLLTNLSRDSQIDAKVYLEKLIRQLETNFIKGMQEVRLQTNIDSFSIKSSSLLYCGLILNELIINSLKHAFTVQAKGEIHITVKKYNETVRFLYRDNGKGLPDNFEIGQTDSLGFDIVRSLANQLNATIDASSQDGARFEIEFTSRL